MYNTESGRVDYRTSEESVLLVGNGGSGWSKGPVKQVRTRWLSLHLFLRRFAKLKDGKECRLTFRTLAQ